MKHLIINDAIDINLIGKNVSVRMRWGADPGTEFAFVAASLEPVSGDRIAL